MNFSRKAVNSIILSTSILVTMPLVGHTEPVQTQLLLAQANQSGKALSIEDIRAQVESRLSSIWSKLPGIANGTAATFDFTINKNGSLSLLKAVQSSGNQTFDNAAKGTIKRVVPLPTLPNHLQIEALNLRAIFKSNPSKVVSLGFAPLNFANQSSPNSPTAKNLKARSKVAPTGFTEPNKKASQPQNSQFKKPKINNENTKKLVNLGVVAMNAGDYKTAVQKLERAIQLNPNYTLAKKNLAIAYNNTGLKLRSQPKEAIKVYHRALFLDPQNERTKKNLEAIITIMGKNPQAFADRKELGDIALKEGDKDGARIEYLAALSIKNSPEVKKQLDLMDGRFVQITNNLNQKNAKPIPKKPALAKTKKTPPMAGKPQIKRPNPKPKIPAKQKSIKTKAPTKSKLNNVYNRVGSLEKKFFGKHYTADDILTRIGRLEKKAFGAIQSGSPKRRLDALLLAE